MCTKWVKAFVAAVGAYAIRQVNKLYGQKPFIRANVVISCICLGFLSTVFFSTLTLLCYMCVICVCNFFWGTCIWFRFTCFRLPTRVLVSLVAFPQPLQFSVEKNCNSSCFSQLFVYLCLRICRRYSETIRFCLCLDFFLKNRKLYLKLCMSTNHPLQWTEKFFLQIILRDKFSTEVNCIYAIRHFFCVHNIFSSQQW